jgi:hypothetical protein
VSLSRLDCGAPFISSVAAGQALFLKDEKAWAGYVRVANIEPQ